MEPRSKESEEIVHRRGVPNNPSLASHGRYSMITSKLLVVWQIGASIRFREARFEVDMMSFLGTSVCPRVCVCVIDRTNVSSLQD